MASAPQSNQLPLFYNSLEPLSSEVHASYRFRPMDSAPFLVGQHAIPITVDEFTQVQRFMPIVFTADADPVPLALMGMNEGTNVFIGEDGRASQDIYIPAYVRRYPFMLVRLQPDSEQLSLCFDPTSNTIGAFDDGEAIFEDGQPSTFTKNVLEFNDMFEQALMRTRNFMNDLKELELLMDGELSIQPDGAPQPFVYRGFQMVNEEKLRDLRGDQLRKINQNGLLPLLYAHLFSLSVTREIFGRQMAQGKAPAPQTAL